MLDKVEPKLRSDQVEQKLQLPCLGVTLNEWAKQLGLALPTTPLPYPKIFKLSEQPHTLTVDSTLDLICNIVDPNVPKCKACNMPGHVEEQCYPLINVAIAQEILRNRPELYSKIIRDNKIIHQFQRAHSGHPLSSHPG